VRGRRSRLIQDWRPLIYDSSPLDYLASPQYHGFVRERTAPWDTYFEEGIAQWPWELLLVNGPLYAHGTRDDLGSPSPPTYQLVVAHPDLAMEYAPNAGDGQQFKAVLMVEMLGVDYWSWKRDGRQGGPFFGYPLGVGIVTTYADREGLPDWGWGGVVHLNHVFNLGVTFRDGDPGYFVSANISRLFSKATAQKAKFEGLLSAGGESHAR
jgi:hypothetical protein